MDRILDNKKGMMIFLNDANVTYCSRLVEGTFCIVESYDTKVLHDYRLTGYPQQLTADQCKAIARFFTEQAKYLEL